MSAKQTRVPADDNWGMMGFLDLLGWLYENLLYYPFLSVILYFQDLLARPGEQEG